MHAALMMFALSLAACSADGGPDRGRSVPEHIVTLEQAGTSTNIEAGDIVEIHLGVAGWKLKSLTGDARMTFLAQIGGVFRYRATTAGNAELTYEQGQRTATFRFVVR